MINNNLFYSELFSKQDKYTIDKLQASTIGIIGAGGLGSNIAIALTRIGIGKLIIVDFDRVEASNLNRQQYFMHQIGLFKIDALKETLQQISPFTQILSYNVPVNKNNLKTLFNDCDLLIEAVDKAETKQMITEEWSYHFPNKPIILASGIAGIGNNNKLHSRQIGNIYICGDEYTEITASQAPLAPRVAIVAAMQANQAIEIILA